MRPENLDKLIEHLQAQPSRDLDERIDALLDSRPTVVEARVWRRTARNRIAGVAVAAVVLLAVLIGIPLFNGDSNNVWARAFENTRKIGNYSFRHVRIEKNDGPEGSGVAVTTEEIWSVSTEQGVRIEGHANGQRDPAGTTYILYDSNEIIKVCPATREIERWPGHGSLRMGTPREMTLWLLEGDYVELGSRTVDGRVLVGIENRRNSGSPPGHDDVEGWRQEIWFDKGTKLPAIIQVSFRSKSTGVFHEVLTDEFRYDVEFAPGLFTPGIPEGYTPAGINGLRLSAELAGGKYPSYLSMEAVERELGGRTQVEEAIRTTMPPSGKYGYESIERAVNYFSRAVRSVHDSAYYGDRVTAADANQVLMYWGDPCQPCEVVWGDLRMETLSREQLIESCYAAGDHRCLVDLLEKGRSAQIPLLAACLGEVGDLSSIPALLRHADLQQDTPIADVFRNAVEAIRLRAEQRNPSSTVVLGRLFYANGRSVSHGCVHIGTARASADRDGYFVMMAPCGDPLVEQVGYAHRTLGANARLFRWAKASAPACLTITLDWTCTVTGRVVNRAGEPLAGVNVGLCPHPRETAGQNWPEGNQTKTDAEGRFSFENVPIGAPLGLIVENPNTAAGPHRVRIDDLASDENRDLGDIVVHGSEE
ncbi:MAG: carboxypeptidase-like regulatory domain-containing protein [Phycisphaerales bacterium]